MRSIRSYESACDAQNGNGTDLLIMYCLLLLLLLLQPQTIQQTLKRTLQYYEHQVIG